MRRSGLAWLALALAACPSKPSTNSPAPGSQPFVEQPGGAALPIVLVPQFPATHPELWTFEPGGQRIASTEYGDCSIWDVETGRLVHSFEIGPGSDESLPCFTWPAAKGVFELGRLISADERLELDGAEVFGPDGQTLRTLACPHCPDALAHSWAPKGHQVALLFAEPPHMEVWDADTGRMVVSEPLAAASEPLDAAIAWTVDRPFAAWSELVLTSECDEVQDTCEWDEEGNPIPREVSERRLQALGRAPIELGREHYLELLLFDPEARFVAWTYSWDERRAGTTEYLEVDALDGSPTGLAHEYYFPYDDYEGATSRHGEWRSDGAVHYGVVVEDIDFEGSPQRLAWEELVVSPALGRSSGTIAEDLPWGSVVEVVPYGLVEGSPRVRGVICQAEPGGETCSSLGVAAPPDCELLDVGSGHGAELHDCGGRVMLRSGGKQHVLPLDAAATFWWWMRGGALVLDDGDRLMVVDAGSGAIGLQRDGVVAGLDAKLGPELDRFVIVDEQGIELLDTRSLQIVARIAEPIVDAALSPGGDRLALLGSEGEVIVHALPGGELLGRFASPAGSQLAFRQDGAALWVGDDAQPLALLDAASGQAREPELVAAIATALGEGGEIDPTWRFVVNDEFGSLMRTLDGRQLEWIGEARSTAIVPDTGQYQGPPPGSEHAFRVGNDPMAVPEFDAAALADQLAMPDLVERFLRGDPIPAPTIDPSALAALRAAKPRRAEP